MFRYQDRFSRLSGNQVVGTTKTAIHNTRFIVQQTNRAVDLGTDIAVSGAIVSGRPEFGEVAKVGVITSLGLTGVDEGLKEVEDELNRVSPDVQRSQTKVSFTKKDLENPEEIPLKFARGFVEGDLSNNEIHLLDEAESFHNALLKISPTQKPVEKVRQARSAGKQVIKESVQELGDLTKNIATPTKSIVQQVLGTS